MKSKGVLILGLVIAMAIIGYLSVKQKKTMVKKMKQDISVQLEDGAEIPQVVNKQVAEKLKKAQDEQDKQMPDELKD